MGFSSSSLEVAVGISWPNGSLDADAASRLSEVEAIAEFSALMMVGEDVALGRPLFAVKRLVVLLSSILPTIETVEDKSIEE